VGRSDMKTRKGWERRQAHDGDGISLPGAAGPWDTVGVRPPATWPLPGRRGMMSAITWNFSFPASSSFALACCGTSLRGVPAPINSETVWEQRGAANVLAAPKRRRPKSVYSSRRPRPGRHLWKLRPCAARGQCPLALNQARCTRMLPANADFPPRPVTRCASKLAPTPAVIAGTSARGAACWPALDLARSTKPFPRQAAGFLNIPSLYPQTPQGRLRDITLGQHVRLFAAA